MKLIGKYINGNYKVAIFNDGTKIRHTDDNYWNAQFPENIDLKITNNCDMRCPYCHENSTINGKHGDIMNMEFIDTLMPYTEVACLKGDTIVYGIDGAKEIKDLKIGDKIFDSDNKLRTITNINKSTKDVIQLKGKKGFNVFCSKDHPFMSNNQQIKAENMVGTEIDTLQEYVGNECDDYYIDMIDHIKPRNEQLESSRGGKLIDYHTIRLRNCTKAIPRYIKVTKDLMWLYGLFVAEGSSKGLTLHIDETEYAEKAIKIWEETFNQECKIIKNESKHSQDIELRSASLIEDLFINEMKVNKGARNKSIGYLFQIQNQELIRQALLGLFDGDGCYRTRKDKNGNESYTVSLKTTSKKLVYEVSYLIAKWFGVKTSIHYGISKERKIEDRILKKSDYYALYIYNRDDINKIFYDRFNMKPPVVKETKKIKNAFKVETIIETNKSEELYDITLENGSHIFPINGYFLTHNCGGGNALEHPDLIPFLKKLKQRDIIVNITVNQYHFLDNVKLLKELIDKGLIKGLGISLMAVSEDFISEISKFENAVIHIINGVELVSNLKKLYDKDLKVLILGYKEFRRGKDYYSEKVEARKNMLKEELPNLINHFQVVSFDNLALEQLDVKTLLGDKWSNFYMGDDGQFTMYIDAVTGTFGKSSTMPIADRLPITNNINDMFEIVKEMK